MEVRPKSQFLWVARVIAVLLLANISALAQPQGPPAPQPLDKQPANDKKDRNQQTAGSHDRLFYALPNFQTVATTEQLPPLTVGQKFKLQARSQFDYFESRGTEFLQGSARLAIQRPVTDKAPATGPAILPARQRVVLPSFGLRSQPHRCHSLRFGTG